MTRILAILALVVGVLFVLADPTWALRKSRREVEDLLRSEARYVDFGVVILVVEKDPNGFEPKPGAPKVKIVGEPHRRGGLYDTLEKKWAGPSLAPVEWLVSKEQGPLVLHDASLPDALWFQGSMGSGKTTAGCIWLALRVIEHATHGLTAAGVTSPTGKRMEAIRSAIFGPKDDNGVRQGGMWPKAWAQFREGDQVATTVTGLQIEFRSTHVQSEAEGSPIQGQNWGFALNDELQDYYKADDDIQMRGRASWKGRYQRFVTVTPKDDPGYRVFRDHVSTLESDWYVQLVLGPNSPFLHDRYWEARRRTMTKRAWLRMGMAQDVPPEDIVYTAWSHEENIVTSQQMRWPDVTSRELAPWGRFEILVGFDPGRLHDSSVLLKAFQPPTPPPTRANPQPRQPLPVWIVIGEYVTERKSTAHHCRGLRKLLRDKWGCNLGGDGPKAFVRADPYGDTANDEDQPDQTVYRTFENHGFHIKAAAYRAGSVKPAKVPKEARIEVVDTLFCNEDGERRLLVACDDNKKPVAPKLVDALERLERDGDGKAEKGKKDKNDKTHLPCALGYSLWSIEKPRFDGMRVAA